MTTTVRLSAAARTLLRQLAEHDQGQGVQLTPRGGYFEHPLTGARFTRATLNVLGAHRYVTYPDSTGLARVTDAGRQRIAKPAGPALTEVQRQFAEHDQEDRDAVAELRRHAMLEEREHEARNALPPEPVTAPADDLPRRAIDRNHRPLRVGDRITILPAPVGQTTPGLGVARIFWDSENSARIVTDAGTQLYARDVAKISQ